MNAIIKFAEIFGSDAFIYHGSSAEPSKFLEDLREYHPRLPGKYGYGLYAVYNLDGTHTSDGVYGYYIYKLKVNLYGFISFVPEITRKIYGKDLSLSEQYKTSGGLNKNVFNLLASLDKNPPKSSDELSSVASNYLHGKVKGIIYFQEGDGDCSLVYDAATVIPVSWRTIDEKEWHKFSESERSGFFNPDMLNSFKEDKYNKNEIVFNIDEITSLLLEASGSPSLSESMGFAAKRLAKVKPFVFLSSFSSETWAQPFLNFAIEEYIEKDAGDFLLIFGRRPWAVNYLDIAANKYIESKPCDFLYRFLHIYPWAANYIEAASIKCIERRPSHFLYDFAKESWAQPYLDLAAKESIGKSKNRFIESFSTEVWANEKRSDLGDKSYIDLAKEGLAKKKDRLITTEIEKESGLFMNKLISLAKVMGSIGQDEFVPSILKLARLSDRKYSEIARNIAGYLLTDQCIPKNRFYTQTTNHQSYSVPESVITDIYRSVDLNVSKGNEGPAGLSFKLEVEIYFPMTDEDYESELRLGTRKEFLDSSLCRKWKKNSGDASLSSTQSGNVYKARIFPRPTDFAGEDWGNKKWINELYTSNYSIYSTLIHEITHIVDKTRTDSEIKNDYKDSHNPDGSLSDDYIKSKIEAQARLMQLFTYLREWVVQESPDLNAENYINSNKQKDPTMEKIILSLYNNDFIKFKDTVFADKVLGSFLKIELIKSDKMIRKYTARLFDMFNYLRGAFGLGAAGGSGSIKNIPNINID